MPMLRILITDADALPALGAVRSLGRAGHYVVAGYPHGGGRPAAAFSRYARARLTHPNPWQHHYQFRQWLMDELTGGSYDVLLPISEAAIVAVAAHRQELSRHVQLLIPSDEALRFTLSKYNATRAALQCGLTIPTTVFLRQSGEVVAATEKLASLPFPIVIKVDNYLEQPEQGGRYVQGRVHSVATLNEAEVLLDRYRGTPAAILAQEKVEGHGVGAFILRHQGHAVLTFAHQRLHEFPYTGGISSLRAASSDPTVLAEADKLLTAIDYEGLAMIEFRQSAAGGVPHFLEINGRIWGSIALALHAGADFPRAWLECQRRGSTKVMQPRYPDTLRCRNTIPGELLYLRSVLRARRRSADYPPPSKVYALWEFILLSLDPRVRSDTLWASDPAPWLGTLYATARQLSRPGLRTVLRRLRDARNRASLWEARRCHEQRARQDHYFAAPVSTVAFLCAGNVCRSPFAERYWNEHIRRRWPAAPLALSAGFFQETERPSPPHCVAAARRFGVDLTAHRSRAISRDLLEGADALFVMDLNNYRALKRTSPVALEKTALLGLFGQSQDPELADPYSLGVLDTIQVYDRMVRALDSLAEVIASPAPRQIEAASSRTSAEQTMRGTVDNSADAARVSGAVQGAGHRL